MTITTPPQEQLLQVLKAAPSGSLDLVLFVTGVEPGQPASYWYPYLDEGRRVLRPGGLFLVQGLPNYLPELGVYLDQHLTFKYWIAIESQLHLPTHGLPSVHAGVLLFAKPGGHFELQRVRFPHATCAFCGRPLRDWGGKAHLMHPEGYALSDVWKDLPPVDNYRCLGNLTLETLLKLGVPLTDELQALVGPREGIAPLVATEPAQLYLPGLESRSYTKPNPCILPEERYDVVLQGDAVEWLRQYPDESVDLVFADPPYNLDKAYHTYEDGLERTAYLEWCNTWLDEYCRILKPTGSLYLLNLPHWSLYHAAYLNRRLHFQNWIVWDALSEPRGKLLPAHYSLLFYTKHATDFTFNYSVLSTIESRQYCLRASCRRQRQLAGVHVTEPLTDFWWDIHRIKHRRDRDYHPCQLPDALLERIILLSTNPGDVVVDALVGTGTTAVVAARLGRRYVAIDLDENYVQITRQKLAQIAEQGHVIRSSVPRPVTKFNKKALQLELRRLAAELGRLPTPEDVLALSHYPLTDFLEAFPSWGKALKAAKLETNAHGSTTQINFSGSLE